MKKQFFPDFLLAAAVCCLHACSSAPVQQRIIGTWQVDSIYDYYNGFDFMNKHPHPAEVFRYGTDSIVSHEGMGEQLLFRYYCNDSALFFNDMNGNPVSEYIILYIDKNHMVLRKDKSPLFPGKNQEKYEVRYFSKVSTQQ
ncbi:hypothetical protein [Agriterribacter sp.]|uniref:hypothetical protein n=1 Tax=Agriterribacter sp. TaxID=2821509 RepID=UPI002B9BF4D1|nr:hypothetical protein [Agriterribacter sp.]HRP57474.1 hypothetical protein [Agriterribacter sp.]